MDEDDDIVAALRRGEDGWEYAAADEIEALRAENAKLRAVLSETSNLLHELTAIIPGNDTAGAEVARMIRAARAALEKKKD